VREPLLLRGQLDVLVGLGVHPLDLGEAEPQQLSLARALLRTCHELVQLGLEPCPTGPRVAVVRQRPGVLGPRELVERGALVRGCAQPCLVRLAVHRHQLLRELGEHTLRHGAAADERA